LHTKIQSYLSRRFPDGNYSEDELEDTINETIHCNSWSQDDKLIVGTLLGRTEYDMIDDNSYSMEELGKMANSLAQSFGVEPSEVGLYMGTESC
jgi:hypothetical protein